MDLGPESNGPARIRRKAYLITLARVLLQTITGNPLLTDPSTLDRQAILDAVRNAVDFPALGVGGGRPSGRQESPIEKIVVLRENTRMGRSVFTWEWCSLAHWASRPRSPRSLSATDW